MLYLNVCLRQTVATVIVARKLEWKSVKKGRRESLVPLLPALGSFSDLCWLCSSALLGARGTWSLFPCENAESNLADMHSAVKNPSDCSGVTASDADPC